MILPSTQAPDGMFVAERRRGREWVHAADGWLEVHMSTGRGRDGRLYYRKDAQVWSVLVSDKAAQPNDFQWLKAQ